MYIWWKTILRWRDYCNHLHVIYSGNTNFIWMMMLAFAQFGNFSEVLCNHPRSFGPYWPSTSSWNAEGCGFHLQCYYPAASCSTNLVCYMEPGLLSNQWCCISFQSWILRTYQIHFVWDEHFPKIYVAIYSWPPGVAYRIKLICFPQIFCYNLHM